MNKEEIEDAKQCLNEVIQNTYAEGKAIKLDYLRKYIESLELTLEQKESILDKVTDKLKEDITTEDIKDDCSLFVRVFKGNLIERFKEVIADVLNQYRKEILNIIEGEKK